jgi:hypothetical protein
MAKSVNNLEQGPSLLETVALLADDLKSGLSRGQVGTVVKRLDASHVLVEFSDDTGQAYAVELFATSGLLVLRYAPEAA